MPHSPKKVQDKAPVTAEQWLQQSRKLRRALHKLKQKRAKTLSQLKELEGSRPPELAPKKRERSEAYAIKHHLKAFFRGYEEHTGHEPSPEFVHEIASGLKGVFESQHGVASNTGRPINFIPQTRKKGAVSNASLDHIIPISWISEGKATPEQVYSLKNVQFLDPHSNVKKNGDDILMHEAHSQAEQDYRDLKLRSGGRFDPETGRVLFSRRLVRRLKLAATLAASANTDEGLSFESALNQMRSANQKAFKDIIGKASHALGLKPHLEDAIVDWTDGAEHSVLQRIHEPIDERTSEYLAAWYGLLANQKSVLVFHPKHQGPDSTYEIDLPETDLSKIRESLNSSGIPFRTIVPTRKGTKVVVYDEGRQLRNNVAQFGETHNADIRESQGQGRYIGGSSRAQARSKYRRIITAYEARTGHSAAGRYAQTQAGPIPSSIPTIRDYNSGTGNVRQGPAETGSTRQEPARMSKGLMNSFKGKWETIKENLRKSHPEAIRARKWQERDRRAKELQERVKESRVQAPVGGMIVRGIFYPGGRMIPTKNYEEEQKARYQRGDFAGALKAEAEHKARLKYAAEETGIWPINPVSPVSPSESPSSSPFSRLRSQIAKSDSQIQEAQGKRAAGISQDIAASRTNPYQSPQRTQQLVQDVTDSVRNGSPPGTVQQTPQERAAVSQRIQQRPWEDPNRPNAGSNSARAWGDVNARLRKGIAEQNARLAEQNVNRRLNDREEALQRGPNVRSAAARAVGRTVPPSGQATPTPRAERVNPNYIPPKGASPGFNPNTGTGQTSR